MFLSTGPLIYNSAKLRSTLLLVLHSIQWRLHRWCKWCSAPGPTCLRAATSRTRQKV